MAILLNAPTPGGVVSVGTEAARRDARPTSGRAESRDQPPRAVLACRDILDEVQRRMIRQGFSWD